MADQIQFALTGRSIGIGHERRRRQVKVVSTVLAAGIQGVHTESIEIIGLNTYPRSSRLSISHERDLRTRETYILEQTDIFDHGSEPCPLFLQADDASYTLSQCHSRPAEWYRPIRNLQNRQSCGFDLSSRRIECGSWMRSETGCGTSGTRLTCFTSCLRRSSNTGYWLSL